MVFHLYTTPNFTVLGIEWILYIIVMVLIFVGFGRKQSFERVERVTEDLKVTRAFSTLVEEMKAIGRGESPCTEDMVPGALSERSPVLLFMGGGMGAGKSTVTKDILKE